MTVSKVFAGGYKAEMQINVVSNSLSKVQITILHSSIFISYTLIVISHTLTGISHAPTDIASALIVISFTLTFISYALTDIASALMVISFTSMAISHTLIAFTVYLHLPAGCWSGLLSISRFISRLIQQAANIR
jgi:hypothetical protein